MEIFDGEIKNKLDVRYLEDQGEKEELLLKYKFFL